MLFGPLLLDIRQFVQENIVYFMHDMIISKPPLAIALLRLDEAKSEPKFWHHINVMLSQL